MKPSFLVVSLAVFAILAAQTAVILLLGGSNALVLKCLASSGALLCCVAFLTAKMPPRGVAQTPSKILPPDPSKTNL